MRPLMSMNSSTPPDLLNRERFSLGTGTGTGAGSLGGRSMDGWNRYGSHGSGGGESSREENYTGTGSCSRKLTRVRGRKVN